MRYEDADPIYLTRYGSHAFGLATATSDLDLRGVFVAPREYFLGFLRRVERKPPQAAGRRRDRLSGDGR